MNGNPMQMVMQMLMNGGDVDGFIKNLSSQNTTVKAVMNQQKQSGMNMKDFVTQYAKQNNINIDNIINMIKKQTNIPF